jgi:RNA-binding motif X-linked protein 2
MTEGDLVIVFSQYGEIVDCRIVRDKETGKSKGFGFICYEDQRSTILAVDNLNGTNLCGRVLRVDHVEQYKIPKEYFEQDKMDLYKPSGPDGKGWGDDRFKTKEEIEYIQTLQSGLVEITQNVKEESRENLDEDERWEKQFVKLIESKKNEEEEKKRKKLKKKQKKREKKLKKEAKKSKRELEKKLKDEQITQEILNNYLEI